MSNNIQEENKKLSMLIRKLVDPQDSSNSLGCVKTFKEKVEVFVEKYIYELLLDDELFEKEEQAEKLKRINNMIEEIENLLSHPWIANKVKVGFVGKFNSGKSSIINSILSTDIIPTGPVPTTSIPTYISYVPIDHEVVVVNRDKDIIGISIEELRYLNHRNLGDKCGYNISEVIQYLIDHIFLNVSNELLKDIAIVDTPGYNPGKESNLDRSLALDTVKECDAVFWVMDIQDGDLTRDAIETLKMLEPENLYIILNKVDKKPPRSVKAIEKKVKKTLEKNEIPYQDILMFSSKRKTDEYLVPIIEILEDLAEEEKESESEIKEFFELLEEIIDHSHKELINMQMDLIDEVDSSKNKEREMEKFAEELNNKLIEDFQKIIEKYFEYEVPFFDSNHYKIYEKDWENFIKEVFLIFSKYVDEYSNKYHETLKLMEEKTSIEASINEIERYINLCRYAKEDLKKLREDFEEKCLRSMFPLAGKEEKDEGVSGILKKFTKQIFGF